MNEIRLPYGLRGGDLLHISEVGSGLTCDCVCPCCGTSLVAHKGPKVQHHFSHYDSRTCEGSTETALHLAAKEVLEDAMEITLPAVNVVFGSYLGGIEISTSRKFDIDRVEVETRTGSIVPDLIATIENRLLIIEIFVTHGVDARKIEHIREMGVSAIEIDLSEMPRDLPREMIRHTILDGHVNKRWLYNTVADSRLQQILNASTRKPILQRGGLRVPNCPIKSGQNTYADVIRECAYCDHCVEIGVEQDYIKCSSEPLRRTNDT